MLTGMPMNTAPLQIPMSIADFTIEATAVGLEGSTTARAPDHRAGAGLTATALSADDLSHVGDQSPADAATVVRPETAVHGYAAADASTAKGATTTMTQRRRVRQRAEQ